MKTSVADFGVPQFHVKLLAAMALVVAGVVLAGLYLAERSVRLETEHDLRRTFAAELKLLRTVRDIRHATLAERCRLLVLKPRIHAALEDNALDLLYPSAQDELKDVLPLQQGEDDSAARHLIRPRFYRFLNGNGAVIPPSNGAEYGELLENEVASLSLENLPAEQQHGSFVRSQGEILEVIYTPIVSMETGGVIASLVAGFPWVHNDTPEGEMQSGLFMDGRLHLDSLEESARATLEVRVNRLLENGESAAEQGVQVEVGGTRYMLFVERLNPGSMLTPCHEVGIYPLTPLLARQAELRWRAAGAVALLLCIGLVASYSISSLLADPVRKLALVSKENRILRERAEAALEIKRGELERSVRFSSDASHQLKTPVAVLRAGLDEVLARDEVPAETQEEIAMLVHQTFRLTSIIEDLLFLSRLDAGNLKIECAPLDLQHLVATCADDLELLHHDDAIEVQIEIPDSLRVLGDRRYTMLILQNLLENAFKYGMPGAPIRIAAHASDGEIVLSVAGRSHPIPRVSWESIFDRFHRGDVGENIPGHGLGLNLARELARLQGGDLRLVRSDEEETVFEVRFPGAEHLEPA